MEREGIVSYTRYTNFVQQHKRVARCNIRFQKANLNTTITHRTRNLSVSVIHSEEDAEIRVRTHHSWSAIRAQSTFIHHQASSSFQKGVEAVKDCGVAKVHIIDEDPRTSLQRLEQ